jgi:ACT domain-containing protein
MTKKAVEDVVGEPIDGSQKAMELWYTLNTLIGAIVPTDQEEEIAEISKMDLSKVRGATLDTILEAAALYGTQQTTMDYLQKGIIKAAVEQFTSVLKTLKKPVVNTLPVE